MIRTFQELSIEEQDTAIGKVKDIVVQSLVDGSKEPLEEDALHAYRTIRKAKNGLGASGVAFTWAIQNNPVLMDWVWDISGAIAADSVYIPDDGALVVKI